MKNDKWQMENDYAFSLRSETKIPKAAKARNEPAGSRRLDAERGHRSGDSRINRRWRGCIAIGDETGAIASAAGVAVHPDGAQRHRRNDGARTQHEVHAGCRAQ